MDRAHARRPAGARIVLAALLLLGTFGATACKQPLPLSGHQLYSSPQTNPVVVSEDGLYLLVANTTSGTVSVFDRERLHGPSGLRPGSALMATLHVGHDPVAVAQRPGSNQYWVANHISDTVSILDLDELLSRVKNLIRLHTRTPGGQLSLELREFSFGNAQVDFQTHEVLVDGEAVRMTRLELELLKHFIQNEGRVISREELLREVWQMPHQLNSRAPDQFVRRLRKIFEPEASKPRYFLTVRETGYRFVSDGEDR